MSEEPRRRTLTLRCDARLFSEMSALIVNTKVFADCAEGATGTELEELVAAFVADVRAYETGKLIDKDGV